MYGSFIHHSPRALLTSNDPFGNKIRSIAKRLSTEDVQSRFKIREGTALEQIHSEIKENNIDLLIMEAEPKNNMWRWLIGEIVGNLYSWFDQTLLITQTN
jgi:nucleotide-binding universal stress UspA family protein